jgi:Peptidase family M23
MKRVVTLLPVLLALQVGVQPAFAWTWPVDGPVLRPFVFGEDPYVAGHHRGVDLAAPAGATVRAPAGGTVSFAGTVPGGGRTVTIATPDGYSVTLLHLGAVAVARSAGVAEGEAVGTVGPTGEVEHADPYVHLGVRLTAHDNGYVDPLRLLPPAGPPPEPAPEPVREPEPVPAGPGHRKPDRAAPAARDAPETNPSRLHAGAERRSPRPKVRPAPERGPRVARPDFVEIPPRTVLGAFEWPQATAAPRSPQQVGPRANVALWATGALGSLVAAVAAVLFLRRQLRNAGAAHRPAPVLLEAGGSPAEHARRLRLGEEDGLVLHGDLEGILLAEPEALPNLDRDDDAPQLVEMPDDSGRHGACRARHRSRRLSRPHRLPTRPFSAGAHA